MLYEPSYPQPYLNDIDVTKENTFSCYINAEGGTQVTQYNLFILDLNGNQIYTTGIQQLSTGLYSGQTLDVTVPDNTTTNLENGVDYVWKVTLYESNPSIWVVYGTIQSDPVSTETNIYIRKTYLIQSGMFLKIRNEIRLISTYDSETGLAVVAAPFSSAPTSGLSYNVYSNNVTSNEYFFQARTSPTLSIDNVVDTIENKSYTFTGTYTQPEGVNYKYFQWFVYDANGWIIDQSDRINSGAISFSYDGFLNGETYGIQLLVENQDNSTLETEIEYFNVSYAEPDITNSPEAMVNCTNNSVEVFWSPPLINAGVAEGTGEEPYYDLVPNQPFQGGSSVNIHNGASIYWYIGSQNNPVDLNYESTTYINFTVPSGSFDGVIYKQEGVYVDLLTISGVAPAQCEVGDKYYNNRTKLVYTAVGENQWSSNGETPSTTNMYRTLDTNKTYLWNTQTEILEETDQPNSSYTVSYSKGVFYYDIINIGVDIHGSVKVADLQDLWLLQPLNADPEQSYVWVDDETWNDARYWTESTESILNKNWFKLTLLPTGLQVIVNPIPDAA